MHPFRIVKGRVGGGTLIDELLATAVIRVLLRMLSVGPLPLTGLPTTLGRLGFWVTFGADLRPPALPTKLVPPRLIAPIPTADGPLPRKPGPMNVGTRADFAGVGALAVEGAIDDVGEEARPTATALCKPGRPIPTLRASTLSAKDDLSKVPSN
jgi:hypothetical protein